MRQGLLLDTINPEPVRHPHHVPSTSRAAHTAMVNAGKLNGRKAEVLQWLTTAPYPVTAAELSLAVHSDVTLELVLHIRRGLSDLRKAGLVDKSTDRLCHVTKTTANTWRVCGR